MITRSLCPRISWACCASCTLMVLSSLKIEPLGREHSNITSWSENTFRPNSQSTPKKLSFWDLCRANGEIRSWAYNRFGVLMGTSSRASCPRWPSLRGNSWPMITLFSSQGDFCATATKQMPMPGWFLHFIGVCEVLGALGLILPWLTRIRPGLTPLAACGLVIIMIGAVVITLIGGMGLAALISAVVGLLAAFVAYGRGRIKGSDIASLQKAY